jgi:hypothetical protein
MGGFRRDLDSTGRALRRMAVGALAVAGIGGLGYMLKKQMEVIDSTAKLADRLGMSTEALIGMQHGANIAGVEAETLNKALSTLSSRLGEVDMGVGQATYALEKLGLNYKDLIGLNMDEAVGIVADQIRNLSTQAEKAAAANYLFGKSGKQLLNLFEEGSAGIAKYQEEVKKLGLSFSRIDAAQVEAANDALTRTRAVLTGLFRTATIELAPYIEVLADKFVDVSIAGEGMGANVSKVFEMMARGAIAFGSTIQMVGIRHKQLNAIVLAGTAKYFELLEKIDFIPAFKGMEYLFKRQYGVGFGEFAAALRDSAKEWKEELADLEKETKQRSTSIEKFFNDLRTKAAGRREELEAKAKQRAEGGAVGVGVEPLDAGAMLEHYDKLIAKGGTNQEMQERMARQRIETDIEASRQRYEAEDAAARDIEKVWTEMWLREEERAYHAWRAPMIEKEKQIDNAAERHKRINEDVALSMAQSWTSAIDQMMFEGKKFWDAMEDMARSLTRMIANILIYRGIAEPIATGIMGTKSAQHGGVFTRPTLVQAGEVPEAFVPLVSGKIPVEMRGGGSGGERSMDVRIHNEGSEKLEISAVEEYMISDRRVIEITMQAMLTDLKYRRSIKQASRG